MKDKAGIHDHEWLSFFKGNQLCIPEGSLRIFVTEELHAGGVGSIFGRDKTEPFVKE